MDKPSHNKPKIGTMEVVFIVLLAAILLIAVLSLLDPLIGTTPRSILLNL